LSNLLQSVFASIADAKSHPNDLFFSIG
jgi:hypothetical protein